jgi:hypothetical protein
MRLYEIVRHAGPLTEAPQRPELTATFWAWFGDSKTVNRKGEPLILYHGTGVPIEAFRGMVWASNMPGLANDYADFQALAGQNPNVIPLFMKMEHPFHADLGLPRTVTIGEFFGAVVEQATDAGFQITDVNRTTIQHLIDVVRKASRREESGPHYGRHDFWNNAASTFGQDGAAAILQTFKVAGFDGIQMIENGVLTYGAFRSEQVKSVFNRGLYDPKNPQISENTPLMPMALPEFGRPMRRLKT